MTANGNGWNSFMQSKQVQTVMYGICVFFCLFYAVDGVMELMSPERSANMMEAIGAPGYYAITIVRCVVLVITGIAFGRIALRTMKEDE